MKRLVGARDSAPQFTSIQSTPIQFNLIQCNSIQFKKSFQVWFTDSMVGVTVVICIVQCTQKPWIAIQAIRSEEERDKEEGESISASIHGSNTKPSNPLFFVLIPFFLQKSFPFFPDFKIFILGMFFFFSFLFL